MLNKITEIKVLKSSDKISPLEAEIAELYVKMETENQQASQKYRKLKFLSAREIKIGSDRRAIVIKYPPKQLKYYRSVMSKLVKALEKRFQGAFIVFIANRKIIPKPPPGKLAPKRPYSKTKKAVFESILEDLVFPREIVSKTIRYRVKSKPLIKVTVKNSVDFCPKALSAVAKKILKKKILFYPEPKEIRG